MATVYRMIHMIIVYCMHPLQWIMALPLVEHLPQHNEENLAQKVSQCMYYTCVPATLYMIRMTCFFLSHKILAYMYSRQLFPCTSSCRAHIISIHLYNDRCMFDTCMCVHCCNLLSQFCWTLRGRRVASRTWRPWTLDCPLVSSLTLCWLYVVHSLYCSASIVLGCNLVLMYMYRSSVAW